MKSSSDKPISADKAARPCKTRDSASPTRVEQKPRDEEAQRYADVIAQVRERIEQQSKKAKP